jgi:hypothetical protein
LHPFYIFVKVEWFKQNLKQKKENNTMSLHRIFKKMLHLKKLFFFLVIISIITSCKKAPVACFVVDNLKVPLDSAIHCDASCSVNAKQYNWLGSGNKIIDSKNSSKATYKFNIPGAHSIMLQVTNGNKEDIISHVVNVK